MDPKLEEQLNLKTGRGSESERGCQEVGPHGWPSCSLRCRVLLWSVLRKEASLTVNLGLMVGEAAGNILPSASKVGGEAAGKRSGICPQQIHSADVSVNSSRVDLGALPTLSLFILKTILRVELLSSFSCMLRN